MIRNKLREKSGASIFMGLMFLLVCAVVGSVALTASTAAAGKLARQRQNEQDYLTVASAARLLKNRVGTLTYTHTVTSVNGVSGTPVVELTASDVSAGGKVILREE